MKNSRIVYLMGLLLPVLLAQSAFADVAADLSQADGLYKAGQYAQAEQAYLKVIREADPNKPAEWEAAFNARKKLPVVYIATDRLPQAKEAVQQLLSKYAKHEFLPHAIHEIVEGSKPLYKLAQVRQLYQDMVTTQPDGSQALWLKMGMAIASVHLAEDQVVDAVLQNITAQHAQDNRAAEALNHIAWACRKLQRYREALSLYQYVLDNWPQKDRVVFAQQSIAVCQVRLGNRQAADQALDVLIEKFAKDKNVSKLLAWSVYEYVQAGEIEGAYRVFDVVLQTYPEAPETIEALLALATAVIQGGDRARIEPTVQTLLTRFTPTEVKAGALHTVANMLGWKCRDYANQPLEEQNLPGICNRCLLAIANYSLTTWPKSDWAMWAQRDLATVAIHRGDDPNAEAAISRLSIDYAEHKDAPEALSFVANYCLELKKQDEAQAVYEDLVKKYPSYELILLAKAGLGVIEIRRGNDPNAEAVFQEVMTKYANHPKLGDVVNLIALGYYARARAGRGGGQTANRDDYQKALKVWDTVIHDLPQSPAVAQAYYHSAVVLGQELGEQERALVYFQKVAESWPDYKYAWHAQFSIGECYQRLKKDGAVPKDEADRQIADACRTVVERYPDCRYAGSAALWLGQLLYEKAQWPEAAKYLEWFLQKQPADSSKETLDVLLHLIFVYERMGEADVAEQVRRRLTEAAGPDDPRVKLLDARAKRAEREVQK